MVVIIFPHPSGLTCVWVKCWHICVMPPMPGTFTASVYLYLWKHVSITLRGTELNAYFRKREVTAVSFIPVDLHIACNRMHLLMALPRAQCQTAFSSQTALHVIVNVEKGGSALF